jgi:hypothetical protein
VIRVDEGHHPIIVEGNVNLTLPNGKITTIREALYVHFSQKNHLLFSYFVNKGYHLFNSNQCVIINK